MIDEVAAQQVFGLIEDGLQGLLEVGGVVRKAHDADLSALPGFLMIEFGNSDVEAGTQPILQAAQDLAFVFQGMRVGNEDFQG